MLFMATVAATAFGLGYWLASHIANKDFVSLGLAARKAGISKIQMERLEAEFIAEVKRSPWRWLP